MSAPLKEILPGAAIVSTCWGNTDKRVYFQDADHAIREFRYEDSVWSGGSTYDVVFQARPNSPLAIAQWMHNGQSEIRLYSLAKGNNIREDCWSGSTWYLGSASLQAVDPALGSKLAASRGSSEISVYYQANDNEIYECVKVDGSGWSLVQELPTETNPPLPGTSIASIYREGTYKYVFYQERSGTIRVLRYEKNRWLVSNKVCQAKISTPLALIGHSTGNIFLCTLDESNTVQINRFYAPKLAGGSLTTTGVTVAPYSRLSAVSWGSGILGIRIYYQPGRCTDIHENLHQENSGRTNGAGLGLRLKIPHSGSQAVDVNGATYATGYLPHFGDLFSWGSYDPSMFDEVGIITGCINGQIIGEELSMGDVTILEPNTVGNSYAWIYTPGGAIIYKFSDHDSRGDYVCEGQLGSGEPVICAGEFRIDRNGGLESVVAITSDAHASGHYKPDGDVCLTYVARKFENLGVSTSGTSWYWK